MSLTSGLFTDYQTAAAAAGAGSPGRGMRLAMSQRNRCCCRSYTAGKAISANCAASDNGGSAVSGCFRDGAATGDGDTVLTTAGNDADVVAAAVLAAVAAANRQNSVEVPHRLWQ